MFDIGNANSHPEAIVEMMMAGANIVRLNMSHEQEKWHAITVQSIREAGNRMYEYTSDIYPLGVAMNLRGPEIRTGIFNGDPLNRGYAQLKEGGIVRLVTNDLAKRAGSACCFWISYPNLPRVCRPGDKILIDRGAAILQVRCVRETSLVCKVIKGGIIKDEKLVQLMDSIIPLPQISETDNEHIRLAADLECDILIANHVRNKRLINGIKSRLKQIGANKVCVMAKISSQQGLENFDEILGAADAILLDRKSVEIDVGPEKMFLVEKVVIGKCMNVGKPVMLAFHVPNCGQPRIDMNLIANAVLTGTDGIFLKTGTLNCKQTSELLKNIDVICREAESARWQREIFNDLSHKIAIPLDPSQAIIVGAIETCSKSNAAAIIVTTTSGRTATMLSLYRPRCPIVAITRYGIVARSLQLYHGLYPLHYINPPLCDWSKDMETRIESGVNFLRRKKYIKVGDAIIIVSGWRQGIGFTNCIRIIYVPPEHVCIQNELSDFELCL
ncbi:pyruvate kinase isoform X2 [Megachile rotundata]|uniref:pyruvate kinase isoform X2 n=1 Tax=Megachile rotundata TaxID=143995 RepID=UPI0006151B3D|nr:PREDICTED: pyruvate kinase-like isoform X2 [Megachile rotundata]XP_012141373.1 PREDICTED: pyruvate kinase-like isoform X2 [Megachile rotundata]